MFAKKFTYLGLSGIQVPRLATNGSDLPGARIVSTTCIQGGNLPLTTATLALMQFGQLINHDFQASVQFTFCKKIKNIHRLN